MYKAAVVGDHDSIYGFAALGFDIFPVSGAEETADRMKQLTGGNYGIIYITEQAAAGVADMIESYREKALPAIILIPGVSQNTGAGVEGVKNTVKQAVGSDILFSRG